jgi:hypothetical protein
VERGIGPRFVSFAKQEVEVPVLEESRLPSATSNDCPYLEDHMFFFEKWHRALSFSLDGEVRHKGYHKHGTLKYSQRGHLLVRRRSIRWCLG